MQTKQTILVLLALLVSTITFSQVGIGTPTPHGSSILDLESTTKGFLPPRITDAQRDAITSPADGLIIFNTTENCLQWYNGSFWFSGCSGFISPDPVLGGAFTNGFEGNSTCTSKLISVTPCAAVNGASLNNDINTAEGIEYDWIGATDFVSGGSTRALVEIGGQCWYRRNAINVPTAGTGFAGFYDNAATEPALGEGRLYEWSKAMNGASGTTAERAQGLCPTGWHVPSDCEFMYLENSLGMSIADQETTGYRGTWGQDLSTFVAGGTNSSGFTFLLAGYQGSSATFGFRGVSGFLWSSTEANATDAQSRNLNSSQAGVNRNSYTKVFGLSVRCLKD